MYYEKLEILKEILWLFFKHLLTAYTIQISGNTSNERIILIVTDAAPYMVPAFKNLKQPILPQLIHVTCIVHAIHRICEIIKKENVKVNRLVSLMKKVLLKSKKRRNL